MTTLEHDKYFLNEVSTLIDMLRYPRPSSYMDDPVYQEFLEAYIEPVFGKPDKHGNYIHIVLDETIKPDKISGYDDSLNVTEQFPRVAYMAHHDTVHSPHELDNAPFDNRIIYDPTKTVDEIIEQKRKSYRGKPENFKPYLSSKEKQRSIEIYNTLPSKLKVRSITQYYKLDDKGNASILVEDATKAVDTTIDDPEKPRIGCLGADCTTGVWLMIEMIKANVPGVYVIHNEEEIGRRGAEAIVRDYCEHSGSDNNPYYWIDLIEIAISFDRKGTNEIITHQSGRERCASDEFAYSLSELLSPSLITGGYEKLIKSDKGSFTDSYSYRKHVNECINLCVGYTNQHSTSERQDIKFIVNLRNSLILHGHAINNPDGDIVIQRDPSVLEKPVQKITDTDTNTVKVGIQKHMFTTTVNQKTTQKKKTRSTPLNGGEKTLALVDTQKTKSMSLQSTMDSYDPWDNSYYNGYYEDCYEPNSCMEITNHLLNNGQMELYEEIVAISMMLKDHHSELAEFLIDCGLRIEDIVEYIQMKK